MSVTFNACHQDRLSVFLRCTASAQRHQSLSQPGVAYRTSSVSGPKLDWITATLFLLDCLHAYQLDRLQCSRHAVVFVVNADRPGDTSCDIG